MAAGIDARTRCSAQVDWMCVESSRPAAAAGVAVAVLRIRGVPSRAVGCGPGRVAVGKVQTAE